MRGPPSFLFIVALASNHCFHTEAWNMTGPRGRRATALLSRLVDGKIVVDEDDVDRLQPKKSKRCFDFPPYYYKTLEADKRKKKLRVKISSSDSNQKVDEREPTKAPLELFTFRVLESVERSAVRTRLLDDRSYGSKAPYTAANVGKPPSLEDIALATSNTDWKNTFWISLPARMLTFAAAYFSFPYLSQILNAFVTMQPDQLNEITSKFEPVIGILYGTFVSLTLSILYERQRKIQDTVAVEASLLVYMIRLLLSLFRKNVNQSVDAAQCVADQIRTLVASSRGEELMLVMYSDPYARLFDLIDEFEETANAETLQKKGGLLGNARDTVRDLTRTRASRLSDEALALPPTHFLVLNILTSLILIGYIISTLPTTDRLGAPSNESSLIFGILTTTYVLFYNFASDLNGTESWHVDTVHHAS